MRARAHRRNNKFGNGQQRERNKRSNAARVFYCISSRRNSTLLCDCYVPQRPSCGLTLFFFIPSRPHFFHCCSFSSCRIWDLTMAHRFPLSDSCVNSVKGWIIACLLPLAAALVKLFLSQVKPRWTEKKIENRVPSRNLFTSFTLKTQLATWINCA